MNDQKTTRLYLQEGQGINTSEAEGWGLPSFEHAATAAAQIVPGHTGPGCLWKGAAELLKPSINVTTPGSLTEAHLIAPETVAEALESLYSDPDRRQKQAIAAYQFVTQPLFDWDNVSAKFRALFHEVLS